MALANWSTTAALNVESTGVSGTGGGVGIQGTNLPSNFDNALRDIMAQIATFITAGTFTGTTPLILTSTDAGAAAGPVLTFYRNSATPAAADIAGKILFQGEDSAGNTEDYAEIYQVIDDPTSTSEDASLLFRTKVAGTMTTALTIAGTTATFAAAGALVIPNAAAPAPTVEGDMRWDTNEDVFRVGNGSTTTQVGIAMGAVQATTSGTAITFGSIPAGTKRITISFNQVSTNGTNNLSMTIGDSGGLETAGYVQSHTIATASVTTSQSTAAFLLSTSVAAGTNFSGIATLTLLDPATFRWAFSSMLGRGDAAQTAFGAGTKALSAELTQLAIGAGGDTFDAGSINIMYE